MAKTFSEIQVRISANMAELGRAVNNASKDLRKFNTDINKLTGLAAAAFSADRIMDFTKEIVILSGKAEGVAGAFNKLPNSIGLINDLRIATKGTISDFELMQRTVQAFNLGISIKEFPKLLEFATVRAQQTGEEIDYIVQSLVEGIGRKSVLKLDNLGISAERLRNKLGGVSMEAATIGQVTAAFGQIAEEELKLMGSLADTAATKVSQLSSAWTDFKVQLGKTAAPAFEPLITGATEYLKLLSSKNLSAFDKISTILFPDPTGINLAKLAIKDFAKETNKVELSNSGAAAATLYFNQALKEGKTGNEASAISLNNLNLVIKDYQKEIDKANAQKNFTFAQRLESNLLLIQQAWNSTNAQLRKDTNANAIKQQSDADAAALENLISKLKDYDRILRVFKVGEAKEAVKLIADVTTGALLKPGRFADQSGIKKVQERLFGPDIQGVMTPGMLFGPEVQQNIDSLVQNANSAVYTMERLRNISELVNKSFQDAAAQGLSNFVTGLGDVAAGTISIGDNVLRAISGFLKQFGSALISLGLGSQAFQNLMKNITNPATAAAAIAVGTTLFVAGGALSKSMSQKVKAPGSGWGGDGSSMAGNSGFPTGSNIGNQNITITGRLVGSGRDLVAIIENTNFDNTIRKGG